MVKYADVVFPLKIPPLTYKVPEDAPADLKGRIVKAPLMGGSSYGFVVDVFKEADVSLKKELKEIHSVRSYYASETDIQFLKWLSHYYIAPMGIALKSSFFEEIVKATDKEDSRIQAVKGFKNSSPRVLEPLSPDRNISLVGEAVGAKTYKTFFYHAPSLLHEYSFLSEVIVRVSNDIKGMMILVPEMGMIERIEQFLKQMFGQRLCVLHSKLGRSKRADAVRRLISGESDIVIGTRSAIFAPLRRVSLIAVMSEHSASYKAEEGLRYNARDVAVMKGFIEKRCVLLSSVCPSLESVYNSGIGKYTSLTQIAHFSEDVIARASARQTKQSCYFKIASPSARNDGKNAAARPKIKIIAAKPDKRYFISLSKELLQELKKVILKNERIIFLVNRKGYSLIRCGDCGAILKCGRCLASLVFHKGTGMLTCRYCGYGEKVPGICPNCKGTVLETFGAGTERVKEEVEEMLKAEALIVEKRPGIPAALPLDSDVMSFVIGTAFVTGKVGDKSFGAAVFINMDSLLSQPDFRTCERAFQEVIHVSQMIKTGGRILLQTHMPEEKTLRFIRDYDFSGFYKHELSQRRALDYPPFTKIVLLNIFTNRISGDFLNDIRSAMDKNAEPGVEVLGPVETTSHIKSHKYCAQIMIKSKDSRAIHASAKNLLDKLEKKRGLRINVDVDPLKI